MSARTESDKAAAEKEPPLTLAEINGEKLENEGKSSPPQNGTGTGFKIVAGEDSDSIFEDNF